MIEATVLWRRDDASQPLQDLINMLPRTEQAQLAGFRHAGRRRGFIISRVMLRGLLARRTGLPAGDIPFSRDGGGRLQIDLPGPWHCSLSHCEGLVAVIVANTGCGVDIELPREVAVMKLAERYFSAAEISWLRDSPEENRQQEFFRLWTLKEAAVKALGQGLANNLGRLAFSLAGPSPRLLADTPPLQLWQQKQGAFVIAAAVATQEPIRWDCFEADAAALLG